jgi:hypothetical protein
VANIVPSAKFANGDNQQDGWIVSWGPMQNGDIGVTPSNFQPLFVGFADRSIQVEGTFGAGFNMVWEGSNDGVNFHTLKDPFSVLLTWVGAALNEVTEAVVLARPRVTGGDGTTSVTVTALYRRTKP